MNTQWKDTQLLDKKQEELTRQKIYVSFTFMFNATFMCKKHTFEESAAIHVELSHVSEVGML